METGLYPSQYDNYHTEYGKPNMPYYYTITKFDVSRVKECYRKTYHDCMLC